MFACRALCEITCLGVHLVFAVLGFRAVCLLLMWIFKVK